MERTRRGVGALLLVLTGAAALAGCAKVEELDNHYLEAIEAATGCGVQRWPVKTGTDPDVSTVNRTPMTSSIAALTAFPAPAQLPQNNRIAPHERETFQLRDVTLHSFKLEADSDYHLVISDGSRTMITEIPNPGCVGASSPFAAQIAAARAAFDGRFTATTTLQTADVPATLTGVGFFDFIHGQTGVAPNGFELHPVLSICFGTGCATGGGSNDFSITITPTTQTVRRGGSATYAISTKVTQGSAQSIQFSATGLPTGVTATFSPATVSAGGSTTLKVTASATAAAARTAFTVTAKGTSATHTAAPILVVQ